MAKVSIEFDTVEKTLSVMVNEKALANVVEAYVSKNYYGEGKDITYGCSVTTVTEDEESEIRTMTRLVASDESGELVDANVLSKAQADIAQFFSRE